MLQLCESYLLELSLECHEFKKIIHIKIADEKDIRI